MLNMKLRLARTVPSAQRSKRSQATLQAELPRVWSKRPRGSSPPAPQPYQQAVKIVGLGVASGAALLGAGIGTAEAQTTPINEAPRVVARTLPARAGAAIRDLGSALARLVRVDTVTVTWTEPQTDTAGNRYTPGHGIAGYTLEERDANGNFVPRDLGHPPCLDNGVTSTCTYVLTNVSRGLHVYRMRAYVFENGTKVSSDPTNEVSKLMR
jgi:hypothetical protein